MYTLLATETTLLVAAEGRLDTAGEEIVDVDLTGLNLSGDAVRAGDISETELAAARRTVANDLRTGADSPNYLADFYLRETVQGTDASPDDIAALAETVTAEDVAAVARGVELDAVYFLRGEEAGTE